MRTDDGCIIYECLNGEPENFGILVDKYKSGIYALAYAKLGNIQDAQDLTQETFLKAYRNLRSLRRWDSFAFWLHRIASNLCREWLKTRSRCLDRESIEDQNPRALEASSLDSYRDNQLSESVQEALGSLSETYREVLMLYFFGGMNSNDIAKALSTSPTAIRMRLSRAKAQLKEEMIAMMDTAFDGQKLHASFTFQIVEMIKRIKIQPLQPKTLPWGLSLATGLIIAVLGIGTHIDINTMDYVSFPSSAGEPKVLDVGEFPVDVMKVSDDTVISSQQLPGDGLGNVVPDLQKAIFMTPQAEGGTWTKKADMPTARYNLAAIAIDKKIYAIGGTTVKNGNTFYLPTLEEYNPLTDKWTRKNDMLIERTNFSSSVANGKIYAIGGWENGINIELAAVEEYDPIKDKWLEKSNMLSGRQWFSASSVDGKIYVIGGWRNGTTLSSVEEYDPIKDNWIKKANMNIARYWFSTSVVSGKIYAIGGSDGINPVSIVEEYDPKTDTWSRKANMPTLRANFSTGVINNKIYVIGGVVGENFSSTLVEEYDPVNDKWSKKENMPTERGWLPTCAPVVNNKIYVIGGVSNNDVIDIVEEYVPNSTDESIEFKGKLSTTWGDVRTALNK